jgi:hypothetical protein
MRRGDNASANSSKRRKTGGQAPTPTPALAAVMTLLEVKGRFGNARKSMNVSQNDLKKMFDKYMDVFDDDGIMKTLQKLADDMNGCFDGAKEGMENIDLAVKWLRASGKTTKNK